MKINDHKRLHFLLENEIEWVGGDSWLMSIWNNDNVVNFEARSKIECIDEALKAKIGE